MRRATETEQAVEGSWKAERVSEEVAVLGFLLHLHHNLHTQANKIQENYHLKGFLIGIYLT